jgi:hypothetical protein
MSLIEERIDPDKSPFIQFSIFQSAPPQCAPGGGAAFLAGFLNIHAAPAQKKANSAVQRKTST